MANKKYSITLNGVAHEVVIAPQGSDDYAVTVDGELFNITATTLSLEDISNHIVGLSENSFVYTGGEIRPTELTDGTITEGIDYNVTYSNNIEVGTGTVSIIGDGNYEGTVSLSFSITSSEEVTETPPEENNTSTDTSSDTSTEESSVISDDEPVTVEENLEENSNEESVVEEVATESEESTVEEASK